MNSDKRPLVSVLMTAYNRKEFISDAIKSVITSDEQNFELIIVDDCSTDETYDIADQFQKSDPRIKIFKNETNLGDYANRNMAASHATGKYITYLDSDDHYLEGGLAYIVEQMENKPEADWALYDPRNDMDSALMQSKEAIYKHFFERPFLTIGPGGTILKRSFFEKIGGYPEKYGPANDMYFNLKAASVGKTIILDKDFFHYRLHGGQEMNNKFGYLYHNYNNQRDAFAEIDLPLSDAQLKWLVKKNKRRFSVNLVKFFVKERSLKKIKIVLQNTKFSFADFMQGIFHFD